MRRNNDIHGSLSARVSELTSQLGQLREAQWKMRTAIDSLREEQDFRNQLATPSEPNG
jgi:prefoldin subunit 5